MKTTALLLAAVVASSLYAEPIKRADETVVEGTIVKYQEATIEVVTLNGKMTIPVRTLDRDFITKRLAKSYEAELIGEARGLVNALDKGVAVMEAMEKDRTAPPPAKARAANGLAVSEVTAKLLPGKSLSGLAHFTWKATITNKNAATMRRVHVKWSGRDAQGMELDSDSEHIEALEPGESKTVTHQTVSEPDIWRAIKTSVVTAE